MLQLAIQGRTNKVDLVHGRITLGRDPANTVVLDGTDVSGFHAELHCEPSGVFLVDLGSTNGTKVNGQRLQARRELAAWDAVMFASVACEVVDSEGRRPTQMMHAAGAGARGTGGDSPWRLVGRDRTLEITGSHTVGRDAACDFRIDSSTMSRRHARIKVRDGQVIVTDLESSNGTFVNGKRIRTQRLAAGDEVTFDVVSFKVEGPRGGEQTSVRRAVGAGDTRVRSAAASTVVGPAAGAGSTRQVPAATSRLDVVSGMALRSFPLNKPILKLGREPGSDIHLTADSVSSRHAQLSQTVGGWQLTDLQSTNGTFVNDQRITGHILQPGDRVRVGDVTLTFTVPGEAATPLAQAATGGPAFGTRTVGSASDTSLMQVARKVPTWGYGIAAFAVVAAGTGVFLLRDEIPTVVPAPDDTVADLQAASLWTLDASRVSGVVGTPALGRVNDDDVLDVVIPEQTGSVTAVDGERGQEIYRRPVAGRILAGAALGSIVDGGPAEVVVANAAGAVHALGLEGRALWEGDGDLDLGDIVNKPLLVDLDDDGLEDVVVPTENHGLVALNGDRGWKLWDTGAMIGGEVVGTPVADDINGDGVLDIIAVTSAGEVLAISANDDGEMWQQWRSEVGAITYASPAIVELNGAKLVVVAGSGVVALTEAGRVAWQALAGQDFMASPVTLDFDRDGEEDVLVISATGNTVVLSGRFGEDMSSTNLGDAVVATPALFDEDGDGVPEAFVLTESCQLHVLDVVRMRPRLTNRLFSTGDCWASPVLGDIDGDQRLDAVFASNAGGALALSFNRRVGRRAIIWGEFLDNSN